MIALGTNPFRYRFGFFLASAGYAIDACARPHAHALAAERTFSWLHACERDANTRLAP